MRIKLFQATLLVVVTLYVITSGLPAAGNPGKLVQGRISVDKKYGGTWTGTYTSEGGNSDKLSYILGKDAKGQWRYTVKYNNQSGEQTAEFQSLQIVNGKMLGKIVSPNGQMEITIEGKFDGNKLAGTYTVIPKGATEVTEKGTWKVAKSASK